MVVTGFFVLCIPLALLYLLKHYIALIYVPNKYNSDNVYLV